jgi:hypothetical protein
VSEHPDFAKENILIATKGFTEQSTTYKTYTHFSNQQKTLKYNSTVNIFLPLHNA